MDPISEIERTERAEQADPDAAPDDPDAGPGGQQQSN
jgi:hypothetical protein